MKLSSKQKAKQKAQCRSEWTLARLSCASGASAISLFTVTPEKATRPPSPSASSTCSSPRTSRKSSNSSVRLSSKEDRGGILPIHTVGVSAFGLIPSGRMGLHYVAEVGNGRASRSPLTQEPVQNVVDDQNHKAFNLALFARPEAIRGLQVGFSVYRDLLAPINSPRIGETILAAHAVFVRPRFEWLNEALVVRHAIFGTSQVFNTPGFYTQFSRQLGSYRPYFRYQYINASGTEPVFPDVRLRQGPSVGLRYDASESVALKLQYDYTDSRARAARNALALQVGFTF